MSETSYFSYTRPEALSIALSASDTTVELVDGSSLPDPALPGIGSYTVIIGYGTSREEVCTVTAKPTGSALTVVRGEDGTLATAKNPGDVVVHGVSAKDFNSAMRIGDPPTAHAASHAVAGSDPVSAASIGATTPAQLSAVLPIGSIIMWGGAATAPNAGWALCNGTPHGSAALTAVLTTAGSPTPDLTPDLRGMFVVGAGLNPNPIAGEAMTDYPIGRGANLGREKVKLQSSESGLTAHQHSVPAHTHPIDPPSTTTSTETGTHTHTTNPASFSTGSNTHNHTISLREGTGTGDGYYVDTNPTDSGVNKTLSGTVTSSVTHSHTVDVPATTSGTQTGTHTHTVNIGSFTSGASADFMTGSVGGTAATNAHENRPPYYALVYLIKSS